ncbi:MAG TPA: translation elongation factor 4 [Candidatus Marinimicrobia bacterium]|nr:translation elongation factor 4 [Candidatus Neomarinimicrobiota bacterium]HQE95365.1 translation elongation factor 4 [Candidatus Neomarinimicrobiota bacterium]HQH55280.1 translation elongation factor 4 [Candidatus Neomarinimicrobiota bacterium]HQK11450.1 translation elongation factor 4 [Candidatus Neomarinimicrobiota bacterium]
MELNIRNFCIIAHIDHGKSTLADRMLEFTGTISRREMKDQVLDNMDLERERGITIKSHPIQMNYHAPDGNNYILNLIDTPGHVDFSYEVSRSLAACEGALLLVDASQGVEAQTVSNAYLAIENDLAIIPVINKIDLPGAMIPEAKRQIIDLIGCDESEIILTSAKSGVGIEEIFEAIIKRIPPPKYEPDKPLRALIFDSVFDSFRGAIPYVRIFEGEVRPGDWIRFYANNSTHEVSEVGIFKMQRQKTEKLSSGDVAYLVAGVKDISNIKVGDTITLKNNPASEPLPGYRVIKPVVFSGLYPVAAEDFEDLRSSLEKMKLNDSSLIYEPETSTALGFGFRCGYLGLLHMEIVQERLEREFNLNLITTMPNVEYQALLKTGELIEIDNPTKMPAMGEIAEIHEPYVQAEIIVPTTYLGNVLKLCQDKRGIYKTTKYLDITKVQIQYELPLAEIVFDFYDKLKSVSRGYASFDYEPIGYRAGDLVKVDILISGEPVDALSFIVHRDKAYAHGRNLCAKLKELIPRQMFELVVQATIGSKVIARESKGPLRKNVTAKCYGGDITRKRKLLEKQKEGKKRMKQIGRVEVPQEAFLAVLKMEH